MSPPSPPASRRNVFPASRVLPAVLILLALPLGAAAQTSEPSLLRAVRLTGSIRLDGLPEEPAWQAAPRITNFTQRELTEGAPVTERTEVAILYDEDAFYIAFWGYDREPDRIVASRMERDFSWGSDDCFEVIIDTYADHRTGYLFVTNPNGARADALVTDNGRRSNRDWDGVWNVHARTTAEGWFAEFRIPFSTLKFPDAPEQTWGINFERNIRRKREQALWQGWSRNYNLEQVSQAGTLEGIAGVSSGHLIDVRPHLIGGLDHTQGEPQERVADIGVSASYLLTPTFKLNVTVNPDFAQVESDRLQVNLSRFSITYPELREFFLEGQEFFDFSLGGNIQPFYSRRIGIAPDRTEIPILGGVRLLGKQGGTTVGGLVMRTARKGSEPATDYTVVRLKQDLLEESSVGLLLTGRNVPGGLDLTWGADFRLATSSLFGEQNLEASGAVAGTRNQVAGGSDGSAARLAVSYPNDRVEFDASWERATAGFEPGVGFLRREAYQKYYTELQFNPRPSFLPWIQQAEIKPLDVNYYRDDRTGEMQSLAFEYRPLGLTTRSGEALEFNIQREAERLVEPFEILEGSEIPAGTYWFSGYELAVETFSGRPVSADVGVSWGDFYSGQRTEWSFELSWRLSRFLRLSADWQQNRITFGEDHPRVDELGGRADFAFSPNLFGAVGAQWNNEDDEAILNLRINWIPQPGSDFYLVVNQEAETAPARWSPRRTALLSKIVWRIAF